MKAKIKTIILSLILFFWQFINLQQIINSDIYDWFRGFNWEKIKTPVFWLLIASIIAKLVCYYFFVYKKGNSIISILTQVIGGNIILISILVWETYFTTMEGHYSPYVCVAQSIFTVSPIMTNVFCYMISSLASKFKRNQK